MKVEPRFIPAFAIMLSGFLAWAAHFGLIYTYAGLLCARPDWARAQIAGFGVLPLGIGLLTVLTLIVLAAVLAWRGLLSPRDDQATAMFDTRFYRQFTQGGALLGAIGIVWEGLLSISLVPPCWPQ
jgi:hypothetical protein